MNTPPPELTEGLIAGELEAGWGVDAGSMSYLAVGFGSHHWRADEGDRRWFVTVDDLDARRQSANEPRDRVFGRLNNALRTAVVLREWGLRYVVAPVPALDGGVLRRVADRFALALYPYVEGRARAWNEVPLRAERLAILDLVVAVHGAPAHVGIAAETEEFRVANRDELERAMGDVHGPWSGGPHAEPARALLARHAGGVDRLLAHHDRLAAQARAQPERLVLTHGEPHLGNTLLTDHGWMLVDWDTVLRAPPERDLWILADGDPTVIEAYVAATGRTVLPELLEFYRAAWDLAEIATYVALFRQPHELTADVEKAWSSLNRYLDPPVRWPSIAGDG